MDIYDEIRKYYSHISLREKGKMMTKVCCCSPESHPDYIWKILEDIPEEIGDRFYGCGSPLPPALEGCMVLDLGCGTGQDVYLASRLVGKTGRVIGVDMNEDQLAIARKYQKEMAEKWGVDNVTFLQGYIEDLKSLGIEDGSVDVVISNCVINLSPAKEKVFSEIWRVLKQGGELYFSDVFADRRVPDKIGKNPILLGECMGGAMYVEDFRRLMRRVGWEDFRYMSTCSSEIDDPEIEKLIGNIKYTSRTIRAVKLPDLLEDICEQYGQFVIYRGGIEGSETKFRLDDHHCFEKDLPASVCGNTCAMIQNTRFAPYFTVIGDRSHHFGPFAGCGTAPGASCDGEDSGCGCGCGC